MANSVPPWPGDFESVAQQYWSLWGDALRQVGAGPAMPMPGAAPGWQQTVDWWTKLVPGGQAQVDEANRRAAAGMASAAFNVASKCACILSASTGSSVRR